MDPIDDLISFAAAGAIKGCGARDDEVDAVWEALHAADIPPTPGGVARQISAILADLRGEMLTR